MTNTTCPSCGIYFGMPDHYYNKRKEDHGEFYCPNGHSIYFVRHGECKDQQIARLTAERDHLQNAICAERIKAYHRGYAAAKKPKRRLVLPAPKAVG